MDGCDFRWKLVTSLPTVGLLVLLERPGEAHANLCGSAWIRSGWIKYRPTWNSAVAVASLRGSGGGKITVLLRRALVEDVR